MAGPLCSRERTNPFYISPYPDNSCGSCPYGIYSGFVSCGWSDRCKAMAERRECKIDLKVCKSGSEEKCK